MNSIDNLNLHDSTILEICFQSKNDFNDYIKIIIESNNFIEEFKTKQIELIIDNCFKVKANMNMWITGKDTIRSFEIHKNSDWIIEEKEKNKLTPKHIKHAVLELNTSGSLLNFLITKDIEISPIF